MKKLHLLLISLVCGTMSLSAQVFTDNDIIEKELKGELATVLHQAGYKTTFASKDNSLNIMVNGINYWYTIKKIDKNVLGLTLNRKGFKPQGNVQEEAAMKACNEVNRSQFSVKMSWDDDMAAFRVVHQVRVKSCSDLTPQIIKADIKAMNEAFELFKTSYKAFGGNISKSPGPKESNDTVEFWTDSPISKLTLADMKICSLDAKDKEIAKPDNNIKKDDAKYLSPVVTLSADEKGDYKIYVKIINEKGKVLLYPGKDYTIEASINIKKANREYEFYLDKFGTADGKMWEKGSYTVEFYDEDGLLFGTKKFQIK